MSQETFREDTPSDDSQGDSQELAQLAATGDRDALEELLLRHMDGLRAFIRLRTGALVRERERESDLVQSTCREVLAHGASFRYGGEAGFRHWLYTTALRKLVDKQAYHTAERRDAARVAPGVDAAGSGASDADAAAMAAFGRFASPSAVAISDEELERLEAAFARLSDDHREVVLLSRVVGLSRAEVAREMERTEASVRNLLFRALTELSRHLGHLGRTGDTASADLTDR